MADLLTRLLQRGKAVDYIERIMAAFENGRSHSGEDVSLHSSAPPHPVTPSPRPLIEPLTNRELDVLELLATRLQNKEIAEKLFISAETVKGHLKNIYQKLNAGNRREAVQSAKALGILNED